MILRTLVISDIHGCFDEFMELLDLVEYTVGKDRLILLGDYVDRGPKSKEVVQYVLELEKKDEVIILKGNHDERFVSLVERENPTVREMFFKYGGYETLKSYVPNFSMEHFDEAVDFIRQEYRHHIEFLNRTKLYFEDDHFIYVHAGLNPKFKDWKQQPVPDFYTIRETFLQGTVDTEKRIVFGHTATPLIHESGDIWMSGEKIGIDGGCVFGYQLNCLEIGNEGKLTQYEVPSKQKRSRI
ncbi:metallophosphoesterase family protein [Fervidibacillus halotolerans]|uniref:Serine/threonine protein phosphatase n=1 Tax=Fervidibacillus halotolerans TaxID=2980027 RepID=A0A9E8M0Z7_9BACI|nr:metallophosphoesterase family protein [Fervidibacillus halotolerans]WAA13377.1 serine/threonine protein phosphatase [Fervidibacillus halotolerans]